MPKLINAKGNTNIVKIEPSPFKKSPVKVMMEVMNVSGGQPKYTTNHNGEKRISYTDKQPENLTKLPGTVTVYAATVNSNGTLNTGLDEIIPNPYSDLDYYRPEWSHILKGQKKIRRQEALEYKHNKERGYYTNAVGTVIPSKDEKNAPFYQRSESRVLLHDGVTFLDMNNEIHEANYHMLRAHKLIANSYEELKDNPKATHYIVDETEKANRNAESSRRKNKLGARLEELIELSDNTIMDFCKALGIAPGATKSDCYSDLEGWANHKTMNYDEFMDIYQMWKDVASREVYEGYVELYDFLDVPGLLTMRNNKLFWNQPGAKGGKIESWEWKSKDHFIRSFLIAPEYQEEVEILRSQYRAKTRY